LQTLFCSCLVQDSFKEDTDLAKIGPKFPWGAKLEALTVDQMTRSTQRLWFFTGQRHKGSLQNMRKPQVETSGVHHSCCRNKRAFLEPYSHSCSDRFHLPFALHEPQRTS
jgi:hypothetical protein